MFELLNALLGQRPGHGWERSVTDELVRVSGNKRLIVYKHRFDGSYRYCIEDNRYDLRDSHYSQRGFASEEAAKQACEEEFHGGGISYAAEGVGDHGMSDPTQPNPVPPKPEPFPRPTPQPAPDPTPPAPPGPNPNPKPVI